MAARLSDVERAERTMREDALSRLIIDPERGLAPMLGWETFHVRPARTVNGWRTPTEGSLAKGWPDLVLVRARDRRLIFAELKRELEVPTVEQWEVLAILGALVGACRSHAGGPLLAVETHVWRPSDLRPPVEESVVYRVLR